MKIIDAHHHFWSVKSGNYPWLENRDLKTLWGSPSDIPSEFLPEDLFAITGNLELAKSVHVQCGYDETRSADESKWLQSLADAPDSGGFPHDIVAFADFSAPDVEALLSKHCEYKNVRGIRQLLNRHKIEHWCMAERDFLKDDTWRKNFNLLGKYDLSFDLHLYYQQIDDALSLARENPDIVFILNHAGVPADRDTESIEAWSSAIQKLAECPNVVAKISGLGMCDHDWTLQSIRPFVIAVIEAFGVDRCMFASNFPVDMKFSDYLTVWNAYDEITAGASEDERRKLFHDNAENYYRI